MGYKLLIREGDKGRSLNGGCLYTLDGKLNRIEGNGAYVAETSGLTSGGMGNLITKVVKTKEPTGAEAPNGVACYRYVALRETRQVRMGREELKCTGPQTLFYRYYYPDGNIGREGSYKGKLMDGTWRYYYPDGNIEQEGSYKDGLMDSTWHWYYPDGNIEQEGRYKDKLMDGTWHWYYPNGNIKREGSYKEGLIGTWRDYSPNGDIRWEASYCRRRG